MRAAIAGYDITETVAEHTDTLICRARKKSNQRSVVLKILKPDSYTPGRVARFKREYDLISSLNINGIIRPQRMEQRQESLIMEFEDLRGEPLDGILKHRTFQVGEFLVVASKLAAVLVDSHQHRIMYKNINPSNIVYNMTTGEVRLIDLGSASTLMQEEVSLPHPRESDMPLAFISPEQTGRMNRRLDYRTDFYSLGVTFYQMLTGQLPCQSDDILAQIHCHIARIPKAPHVLRPEVPVVVSGIVMKLLGKTPEERYQSATGLRVDLERCLHELRSTGNIPRFSLGEHDRSDRLEIFQKLYGREDEIRHLLNAFERVCQGSSELLLVAGCAGVGKTALVREIQRPVTEKRGFFIEGKFDPRQRNIPYYAWLQAFKGLVNQLLAMPSEQLAIWRTRLQDAVGGNGKVLMDVIPSLELVMGRQPEVPELGAIEAQNRFEYVIRNFIKAFARKEHPLAIFLDDLQWSDLGSVRLLRELVSEADLTHFLLVGAYRDNEVDSTHPLMKTLEIVGQGNFRLEYLKVRNLSKTDIHALISDALHSVSDDSGDLAQLIHSKTSGNAFFTHQVLHSLGDQGVLAFDHDSHRWRWDLARIRALGITDNVVDFMIRKLLYLQPATQELLKLAAFVGSTFDLHTISLLGRHPPERTLAILSNATAEGLILPRAEGGADANPSFSFVHDQVQSAAYLLSPAEGREAIHLEVGNALLADTPAEMLEERIFEIVNQLNHGIGLIDRQEKQDELAYLNLLAGLKARKTAAFSSSYNYLRTGIELLGKDPWERCYDLVLNLYTRGIELASLTGHFEQMERLFASVRKQARTALDQVEAYRSRIQGWVAQGEIQLALDTGLEILALLGERLSWYPTPLDTGKAFEETLAIQQGRKPDQLLEIPAMTDPSKLASMRIIGQMTAPAFNGRPLLFQLLTFLATRTSIQHGSAPQTAYAYSAFALHLCGSVGDLEGGYRFGQLAQALVARLDASEYKSKVLEVVNAHVWHFKRHLRETIGPLREGAQSGFEMGDLDYAGYNALFICCNGLFSGVELEDLNSEAAVFNSKLRNISETPRSMVVSFWQAALNLLGRSEAPTMLSGEALDAKTLLPALRETNNKSALGFFYVNELVLNYLFGKYEQALRSASEARENEQGLTASIAVPILNFYESLSHLGLLGSMPRSSWKATIEKVATNQRQMRVWADHAPMNYLHKWYLVEAELAKVCGKRGITREHYDKAISLARESHYLNEAALACELAGAYYLSRSMEEIGRVYMTRAHEYYKQWQAWAKVKDLEARYPQWVGAGATAVAAQGVGALDLATIMKATQAISAEIQLDRLLARMMAIMIENAGAQKGYLLLESNGNWVIRAEAGIGQSKAEERRERIAEQSHQLPVSVINYVARTRAFVVLNHAAREGDFTRDPYIITSSIKSVMAVPLLHQDRVRGIVYLENNLATRVFTPDRVQLLQILAAQAVISLDNALYYDTLRDLNASLKFEIEERKRAEEEVRAVSRMKSEFLDIAAHELRTPITAFSLLLQVTQMQLAKGIAPTKETLDRISGQANRLKGLVDDLLDVSRLERGAVAIHPVVMDLNTVVVDSVADFRNRAPARRISIESPKEAMCLEADPVRVQQVVANLLENTLKYTPEGSPVEVRIEPRSRSVRVSVSDHGPGIAKDKRKALFTRFFRVSSNETIRYPGLGLGLYICRRIMELHGGTIDVVSELGKGSTFFFELPRKEPPTCPKSKEK